MNEDIQRTLQCRSRSNDGVQPAKTNQNSSDSSSSAPPNHDHQEARAEGGSHRTNSGTRNSPPRETTSSSLSCTNTAPSINRSDDSYETTRDELIDCLDAWGHLGKISLEIGTSVIRSGLLRHRSQLISLAGANERTEGLASNEDTSSSRLKNDMERPESTTEAASASRGDTNLPGTRRFRVAAGNSSGSSLYPSTSQGGGVPALQRTGELNRDPQTQEALPRFGGHGDNRMTAFSPGQGGPASLSNRSEHSDVVFFSGTANNNAPGPVSSSSGQRRGRSLSFDGKSNVEDNKRLRRCVNLIHFMAQMQRNHEAFKREILQTLNDVQQNTGERSTPTQRYKRNNRRSFQDDASDQDNDKQEVANE